MFPYPELVDVLNHDIATALGTDTLDLHLADKPDDIRAVQARALVSSFYKKLQPNGETEVADARALELFLELNSSISEAPFEFMGQSEQEFLQWDYFKDNFLKALTPGDVSFDLSYMRETITAGPGSSLGCNSESFYTKLFDSRITATDEFLLTLYRGAISESDTWAHAELRRFTKFGFEKVHGNRLFFVPKNAEISRTCCTEPAINMLLQQSLGAFLCHCLERSFRIKLDEQPTHNREMARVGSIDGSLGTIDLRSASDSISWSLIKKICPNNLLGYFRLFRSPTAELPNGDRVDLRMISTMGNGFTFPLQTIIFACAVRAVYQEKGIPSSCPRTQFGVFGDDIVVRREAYADVVNLLTRLGFKVNDTKSFNTGPFRESCGYDWYTGTFVRGVYIRSLETHPEIYSAANRLQRWSALTGILLPKTIRFLLDSLGEEPLVVPFSESFDSGFQTPLRLCDPKLQKNGWYAFRKHAARPKKRKIPLTQAESRDHGYKDFNPYGWELCYLGGYARTTDTPLRPRDFDTDGRRKSTRSPDSFMTIRRPSGVKVYKVVPHSIPFWDWEGPIKQVSQSASRLSGQEALVDDWRQFYSFEDWLRVAQFP